MRGSKGEWWELGLEGWVKSWAERASAEGREKRVGRKDEGCWDLGWMRPEALQGRLV